MNANNLLKSANESYEGGLFAFRNEVDQNKVGKKHSKFYGKHYLYRTFKKKMALQLSYQINNNSGNSNFITYDFQIVAAI
jgi:hypothetical protein